MIAQIDALYLKTRPLKGLSRLISYTLFEGRPLTTKGRWINPLVFSLFEIGKRLPQIKKVEKPIFILGTGRSGTTVLGVVLSMHKHVAFLNEPKAMWHSLYPNEDLIGSYSMEDARYKLDEEDATELIKKKAHCIYGAYLACTCSKRVVDKYLELIFRVPFVREIFPDAKFLFLLRNGWDTCHSIEHWSKRLGVKVKGEIHDWWGVNNRKWNLLISQVVADDPEFVNIINEIRTINDHQNMAAVEWIVTMKEGMKLIQNIPDYVHMVRYEDLVANAEKTLLGVIDFCELPYDKKFFDYAHKIVSPAEAKKPFKIHPILKPIFDKTMAAAGYKNI